VKLRVLLFAVLRERLGKTSVDVELDGAPTVAALRALFSARHPELAPIIARVAVAVGHDYARDSDVIPEGAEVALIPPIAGGTDAPAAPRPGTRLRNEPLSLDEVMREVCWPGAGGLATFTGIVRNESRGRAVTELEYEAYPALAEVKLLEVEDEVRRRWPEVRCAVRHRAGLLAIGEAAVVIAVAAPHRKEAFAACSFAIDELKRTVPLWKKESGEGGAEWVEECVPGARDEPHE